MTECARPTVGGFYRHFKNRLYQVLNIAVHADTEEELVIYQALYGDFKVYARPLKDFMSEVDHEKYPDVEQKMRFVKVTFQKAEPAEKKAIKEQKTAETVQAEKVLTGNISKENPKAEEPKAQEPDAPEGVHPLLLKFLDADTVEERLEIFKEMQDVADSHMLDAVAASLDISLGGIKDLGEAYELIFDNLATQKRYEGTRWR